MRVLVEQCLERSPARRPAPAELVRSLSVLADTLRRSVAGAEVDYLFASLHSGSGVGGGMQAADDVVAAIASGAAARAAAAGKGCSAADAGSAGAAWVLGPLGGVSAA
jgi:hypothetical protein